MNAWEWAGALAIGLFAFIALAAIVMSTIVRLVDNTEPTDYED